MHENQEKYIEWHKKVFGRFGGMTSNKLLRGTIDGVRNCQGLNDIEGNNTFTLTEFKLLKKGLPRQDWKEFIGNDETESIRLFFEKV